MNVQQKIMCETAMNIRKNNAPNCNECLPKNNASNSYPFSILLKVRIKLLGKMIRMSCFNNEKKVLILKSRQLIIKRIKCHLFINEDTDEYDNCESISQTIPCDGIPIDGDFLSCEETTNCDHSKNVEDCTSNDGSNTQITLGDKCAHYVGEKFW